jgi:hypothetical protein
MQTRSPVTLSWPRLIGVASGIFGAALTAAFAAQLSVSNSVRVVQGPAGFIPVICGCVFLFLAFPLFTGRAWARRALVLATYCTLAALAISFSLMVFQRSRLPSTSPSDLSLLIGACALVGVLTPPAFLLAALHHADVRRAFQDPKASNHAMERTADRGTLHS